LKDNTERKVSVKTFVLTLIVVSLIVAGMSAAVFSSPGEIFIEPGSFVEDTNYVIGVSGSTFYSKDGQTGTVTSGTNSYALLQSAVDAVSSSGGGSIHVKAGSYSASITLKDGVILTLDKGVSGVSVSIAAGASATLIDLENDVTKIWQTGILVYHSDSGKILTSTSVKTTAIYVAQIENATDGGYVKILKLVVENGTTFPSSPSVGYVFFRTDWDTLTVYNGTSWINMTGGGGSGVTDHGALTGLTDDDHPIYLLSDGTRSLSADWNVGAQGIYGVTWLNSTSLKFTDELWHGSSNRTDVIAYPIQTASYTISSDGTTVYAKNGTTGAIDFSSTDDDEVINFALSNLPNGGTIHIRAGTYNIGQALEIDYDNTAIIGEGVGSTILRVIDQVTSTLASDASSGQKNVVVSDSTGFEVGQQVTIKDNLNQEKNEIASINGNTLTMVNNLDYTYTTTNNAFVATTFTLLQTPNAHLTTDSKYNVTIKDITLDGNHANNVMYETSGDPYYQNVITTRRAFNWTIENVHVLNAPRNGIELIGNASRVSNCYFYNCNWNSLQFIGYYNVATNCISEAHGGGPNPVAFCNYGGSRNQFVGCVAVEPEAEDSAFNVENGATYVSFIGCKAVGGTNYFLAGFSISGGSHHVQIDGCYAEKCVYGVLGSSSDNNVQVTGSKFITCHNPSSDYGLAIFLRGKGNVVSGNYIDQVAATRNCKGIRLDDNANCSVISGNVVKDAKRAWSISVEDVSHCVVVGNVCFDTTNTAYGIRTSDTADYNTIVANDASECTNTQYSFMGSNNVVANNMGYP